MYFYGGSVHSGTNEKYFKTYGEEIDETSMIFNFNDYYHSFISLFMIMEFTWWGYDRVVTLECVMSAWHNVFFLSFFYFANINLLNILIGFLVKNTVQNEFT